MQDNILHIQSVQTYKTQSLIFSVPCADKQIEAANYQLPRLHHITIWGVIWIWWKSSGLAFQATLLLFVNMQRLWFHLTVTHTGRKWNLNVWQQCQLWEEVLPPALCFGYEQGSPQGKKLLKLVGICWWRKWSDSEFTVVNLGLGGLTFTKLCPGRHEWLRH